MLETIKTEITVFIPSGMHVDPAIHCFALDIIKRSMQEGKTVIYCEETSRDYDLDKAITMIEKNIFSNEKSKKIYEKTPLLPLINETMQHFAKKHPNCQRDKISFGDKNAIGDFLYKIGVPIVLTKGLSEEVVGQTAMADRLELLRFIRAKGVKFVPYDVPSQETQDMRNVIYNLKAISSSEAVRIGFMADNIVNDAIMSLANNRKGGVVVVGDCGLLHTQRLAANIDSRCAERLKQKGIKLNIVQMVCFSAYVKECINNEYFCAAEMMRCHDLKDNRLKSFYRKNPCNLITDTNEVRASQFSSKHFEELISRVLGAKEDKKESNALSVDNKEAASNIPTFNTFALAEEMQAAHILRRKQRCRKFTAAIGVVGALGLAVLWNKDAVNSISRFFGNICNLVLGTVQGRGR